jgi:predicted TIM-barrel fold metal-dependent hydrolase
MYVKSRPIDKVQKIREKIKHPVVDADAHFVESRFAVHDFVKKIAGGDVLKVFEERYDKRNDVHYRKAFWASPSGDMTIDRATAMLPALYYERLPEAGIDFAIIHTSEGLGAQQTRDPELRQVFHRALNMLYADMFSSYQDRMTPSAVIPMHTPQEAISELEFAVNELKFKTITIPGEWRGPIPEVAERLPELADKTTAVHSFTIGSDMDYDPFWQRCVELGVSINGHGGAQNTHRRMSVDNFVYNRLGSFGVGNEHLCRSLFLGGVSRRFPTLNIAFLEGGVAWAGALYNDLCEFWEKRNVSYLRESMNPRNLDMNVMISMFEQYGNEYLTADRIAIRENADNLFSFDLEEKHSLDDFYQCSIKSKKDIYDLFVPNFYFGCEADDRMNVIAFNKKVNHYNAELKAMFSSDIGHWDVPDMRFPVADAYKLVEKGCISEDNFRNFMFKNPVEFHAQMNSDFFHGTTVEDEVNKLFESGEIVSPDHSVHIKENS